MRLIVCGSRDWTDRLVMWGVLDDCLDEIRSVWNEDPVIVQGEARGADLLAKRWAEDRGLIVESFPADWSKGRGAGHARNREMLWSGADGVMAFSTCWPATPGTAGMCRLAYEAGLPVTFVTPDGVERHFYNDAHTTQGTLL